MRPDGELSQLVARAEGGEEIVITRNGKPAVKLSPVPAGVVGVRAWRLARAGAHGRGFDEPPDDIADAFGAR